MLKYAKVVDEQTKVCEIGTGTNVDFYRSIGMTEMDVEQGYDGGWYISGHVPQKPIEIRQQEVRLVRNLYLEQTDKFISIPDYPISEEEKGKYKAYRQYLRDYPETKEDWYEINPLSFDEWIDL